MAGHSIIHIHARCQIAKLGLCAGFQTLSSNDVVVHPLGLVPASKLIVGSDLHFILSIASNLIMDSDRKPHPSGHVLRIEPPK